MSIMQRAYDIVTTIGIVCVIEITIISTLTIQILYGNDYAQATKILFISVWVEIQ